MATLFSPCRIYRYRLTRWWGDGPNAGFIMLNPSTADEHANDPTIRRCIAFAQREGCGGLVVVNLFNLRATKPKELALAADPLGIDADHHLLEAIAHVDGPLIAAWGAHPFAKDRAAYVTAMIGTHCVCLGKTKDGHPKHPLYVPGNAPLVPLIAKTPDAGGGNG